MDGYHGGWTGERTIEIPIFQEIVKLRGGASVLEVGNVLSHYSSFPHVIVDKYERGRGVINEDIVTFDPGEQRFDLVVSISTLEHVGLDEPERDPSKFDRALARIRDLLSPGGECWFSVPLGYNPVVDRHAFSPESAFERYYLRRENLDNSWRQCAASEVEGVLFGTPYPYANAVMIGRFGGSGAPSPR
jgi:SAM-dependent methyltransferase